MISSMISSSIFRGLLTAILLIKSATVKGEKILLTNDDGFETPLIQSLFSTLVDAGHEVIMSAPYGQRSLTSARMDSLMTPLFPTTEDSPEGTIPAGSPPIGETTLGDNQFYCDCAVTSAVYYGLDVLCPAIFGGPPDLVLSGPNYGQNAGAVQPHSGTVAGAVTALNRGLPAVAISADGDETNTELVARLILKFIRNLDLDRLPVGKGFSINLPLMAEDTTVRDYTFVKARVNLATTFGWYFVERIGADYGECVASTFPPFNQLIPTDLALPAICVTLPYFAGPLDEDPARKSEYNVIISGEDLTTLGYEYTQQIAVSAMQGTYQARQTVFEALEDLFE